MLTCPHCTPLHPEAPPLLAWPPEGRIQCPLCARSWPQLQVAGAPLACLLPDPTAAGRLLAETAALLADPRLLVTWLEGEDATAQALAQGLVGYAQNHYGRWAEPALPCTGLDWLGAHLPADLPPGPVALLGCGPGGELAALTGHLALQGREAWLVDANPAALAWGCALAQGGTLQMPWRAGARSLAWTPVALPDAVQKTLRQARWLCADVLQPPWAAAQWAAMISVGVLDSVSDPAVLVQQVEAALRPGGVWLVAAPWHWQAQVTPPHKQLHRLGTDMAALLSGQIAEGLGSALAVERHTPHVPWTLAVHPRLQQQFSLEVLVLRKRDRAGADGA